MISRKAFALIFALAITLLSTTACTTNKKKKCNTCPKWTSQPAEVDTQRGIRS